MDFILNVFPDNFFAAFAKGELLQVLVIAIIFGAALLHLRSDKRAPIERGLNTISEAFFEFIHIIMWFAPIGTFGAVAFAVGSSGTAVLLSLIYLVLSFYAVVAIFIVVVLGSICALFKINLFHFLGFIKDEIFIVLGTASSESVLPRLLEKLPLFGCSKQSVGLVLPTGYAFNLDGTSIYMSMGVLFLANAYNVPLDFGQQLGILALMLLTSKGAATVTGGSFVVFAATVRRRAFCRSKAWPCCSGSTASCRSPSPRPTSSATASPRWSRPSSAASSMRRCRARPTPGCGAAKTRCSPPDDDPGGSQRQAAGAPILTVSLWRHP